MNKKNANFIARSTKNRNASAGGSIASSKLLSEKLQLGLSLHKQGQFDQAQRIYTDILEKNPNHFDALQLSATVAAQTRHWEYSLATFLKAIKINATNASVFNSIGNVLKELGRFEEALENYYKAIELNKDYAEAHHNIGLYFQTQGRFEEAVKYYDKSIALKNDYAQAYNNRGIALREINQSDKAIESYSRAIELAPNYAQAYYNRGVIFQELKSFERALSDYEKALEFKTDYAQAYNNRGLILQDLNRLQESLVNYNKAIECNLNFAEAYFNQANVFNALFDYEKALESFNKAIELKADYPQAYSNRGNSFKELKLFDKALESYNKAIELKGDYAQAYNNRGVVLQDLGQYMEARESYERSLQIKNDDPQTYYNRANLFQTLKKFEDALENYDKAIEINKKYHLAYNNRGIILRELGRIDEALASYDKAIELKGDYAEAYNNRGNLLRETKQLDKSLESYAKALVINPDYEYLFGTLIHTSMFICDWSRYDEFVRDLFAKIKDHKKVTPSFPVLALTDSLEVQRQAAQIWVNDKHPENTSLGPIAKVEGVIKPKIRLGYYSADFHDHATAYLMAELFERHDKSKFELIAFSFGPDKKDAMRQRVSAAFDQFLDVRLKSDKEIAELSRELGIDIAVDLKGFTQDQRLGIFSYRAAPIQVSYLGYPGTMAAPYIDYLIADRTLIPEESQKHYSEKIVYLPHSYQVNDRQRVIAQRVFTREELGLPKEGFVFCCFNNNFKITPATFDGWVRVLKAVEGSVLWLLEDNMAAGRNLKKEAQARGLDPNRLVFAKRMKLPEHLARHRAADLFLDTLPYNAHTTASDALWAGLPVLTCMGGSFASRVAASLLNAIELPELITDTQQEYEALAIELAKDSDKLKEIRDKLERNRLTTPLFDTALFTKHIEMAYKQVYERYFEDALPEYIKI